MNGRRARERRRAEGPREETRPVHRTRPLRDREGRFVGHGCDCGCRLILTPTGGESVPAFEVDGTPVPSKSHAVRVSALDRKRSWWRGLVAREDAA